MTTTVLPRSTSLLSTASACRFLSAGWLFVQERDQAVVQMNLSAKNYSLAAEPMSNIYGALYSTLATDDPSQRKSMRYIGSSIGRIFYLLDKAERFEMDKSSGRYNVFVVNDLRNL